MSSYFMPSSAPMSARGSMRTSVHAAAASILAALGLAVATPASAQTVIHACYVPASGTVYRIKATSTPQNCLQPTHVAFNWTDGAEAVAALQNAVKNTDNAAGDVTGVFSNLTVGKLLGRALATTPPTDGQVLSWNAASQKWEAKTVAAGGGGAGVSNHAALSGLAADDHQQYLLGNGVRSTASGFAVSAQMGGAATPLQSPSTEDGNFAFIGAKGALRLGGAGSYNEWAVDQVGENSVAFGRGSRAPASGGIALGKNSVATGNNAIAIGEGAWSTHGNSLSLGYNAKAESYMATAISGGTANGYLSFAVNAEATGERSIAFGSDATGQSAIALNGKASGTSAFSLFGNANGLRAIAIGYRANADRPGSFVIASSTGDGVIKPAANDQFIVSAPHIFFGHNAIPTATTGRFIETGPGAYLSSGGVWTNVSDSTKKSNFRAVDNESVLSKLAAMPVYTWNYTAEDSTTRHMGPTAQAFRAAFGLGDTDKAISTVDIDGVAVAGVKALEARTRSLKTEVIALRQENAELATRLAQLEALMAQLSGNSAPRNR